MSIENPKSNALPTALRIEDVLHAVQASGYPLQTNIASQLKDTFAIHEEWCYVDDETDKLRTIDILAERYLASVEHHFRVRPHLSLLIECKQSELPYVFFRGSAREMPRDFPVFAGLHKYDIDVKVQSGEGNATSELVSAMDLARHPFISQPPKSCTAFSKLARKGKEVQMGELAVDNVEMSGTQAYANLMLPLLKSVHHYRKAVEPPNTAHYFDLRMVVAIGILDAPMLTFVIEGGVPSLVFAPWVRVLRHAYAAGELHQRRRTYAVDMVHKDFFSPYVNQHLLPFAETFGKRAEEMHKILASGKAYAKTLDDAFNGVILADKAP